MIKYFHVINHRGEKLTMELEHPEKSGFLIFNVTGLGPGKAQINMTDLVSDDGSVFKSAKLIPRNVVFSLRFFSWEGRSVEDIRIESYDRFPIKRPITLIMETETRSFIFEGYVETNEPVIFSRETYTTISIVCPNPYAVGAPVTTIIDGVTPEFEFIFSNEDLIDEKLIMGRINKNYEGLINYDGDRETGMIIEIDARGPVEGLILYNITSNERFIINTDKLEAVTGHKIMMGDKILISTGKGQKFIRLLRFGVWINILNILERRSPWFKVTKGTNIFAFRATAGESNVRMTITFSPLYEGV